MRITRTKDGKLILQSTYDFLVEGLIAFLLCLFGGATIFDGFEGGFTELGDYIFAGVFGLWSVALIGIAVRSVIIFTERVTLDRTGVLFESLYHKEFFEWQEIRDWGVSDWGSSSNIVCLYFSPDVLPTKKDRAKKLGRRTAKVYAQKEDAQNSFSEISDFCRKRTRVEPFYSASLPAQSVILDDKRIKMRIHKDDE